MVAMMNGAVFAVLYAQRLISSPCSGGTDSASRGDEKEEAPAGGREIVLSSVLQALRVRQTRLLREYLPESSR